MPTLERPLTQTSFVMLTDLRTSRYLSASYTLFMMNFLKSLFRQEEPRPIELSPAIAKEIATRLKHAAELRLNKQYELAIRECNEILQLHPDSHLAYQIRALAKYDTDDQDGAIRDWNRFKSMKKVGH